MISTPDRFKSKFFREGLSFRRRTSPGAYCQLFEASVKPGAAQAVKFLMPLFGGTAKAVLYCAH